MTDSDGVTQQMWLVAIGEYSDYRAIAVFTSEEKAIAWCEHHNNVSHSNDTYKAFVDGVLCIDPPLTPAGVINVIRLCADVDKTGVVTHKDPDQYGIGPYESATPLNRCDVRYHYNDNTNNLLMYVEGWDEAMVRKSYGERVARITALVDLLGTHGAYQVLVQ